jgi:hypothetical protein
MQKNTKTENEIEKKIEKWFEDKFGHGAIILGETISIIIIVFMIWAAHNVINWDYSIFDFIIDDKFNIILWAIDLSLGVSIITKVVRMFFPSKSLKRVMQITDNFFSIILMFVLVTIFPYDFTKLVYIPWFNDIMRIIFGLSIFGLIIGIITELFKLITETNTND